MTKKLTARDAAVPPRARAKLDAIRVAAGYSFPVGDIGELLGEIEAGYSSDRSADRNHLGVPKVERLAT